MAITTFPALQAALPGQRKRISKANITSGATLFVTLWDSAGEPSAGSLSIGNTTTGVIPTDATAGAFAFVNPASGNSYLARAEAICQNVGTVFVYDRLWHAGSFTSSAGTINATDSTPIDRGSNGAGVELWAEINTALSALATTITVTYTNQDGTAGRTATCTLPASAIARRMLPFALQSGDTGIRSIEDVAGSAAPTGTFNLVLLQMLTEIPLPYPNVPGVMDWADIGMARIYNDACIAMMIQTASGGSGILHGALNIAQG